MGRTDFPGITELRRDLVKIGLKADLAEPRDTPALHSHASQQVIAAAVYLAEMAGDSYEPSQMEELLQAVADDFDEQRPFNYSRAEEADFGMVRWAAKHAYVLPKANKIIETQSTPTQALSSDEAFSALSKRHENLLPYGFLYDGSCEEKRVTDIRKHLSTPEGRANPYNYPTSSFYPQGIETMNRVIWMLEKRASCDTTVGPVLQLARDLLRNGLPMLDTAAFYLSMLPQFNNNKYSSVPIPMMLCINIASWESVRSELFQKYSETWPQVSPEECPSIIPNLPDSGVTPAVTAFMHAYQKLNVVFVGVRLEETWELLEEIDVAIGHERTGIFCNLEAAKKLQLASAQLSDDQLEELQTFWKAIATQLISLYLSGNAPDNFLHQMAAAVLDRGGLEIFPTEFPTNQQSTSICDQVRQILRSIYGDEIVAGILSHPGSIEPRDVN